MSRPVLRVQEGTNLLPVPSPVGLTPLEHFREWLAGTDIYPVRDLARLRGKAMAWERAAQAGADAEELDAAVGEYLATWHRVEFSRMGSALERGADVFAAAPVLMLAELATQDRHQGLLNPSGVSLGSDGKPEALVGLVAGSASESAGKRENPTWPTDLAPLVAWLDDLGFAELPEAITLRPGVTVTHVARFVASLRATVAQGPGCFRARRGLLADDLRDLYQALAADSAASRKTDQASLKTELDGRARHPDDTPADHLTRLGGWADINRLNLPSEQAHLLWDAARLWERDRNTERAARWAEQYWRLWSQARGNDDCTTLR